MTEDPLERLPISAQDEVNIVVQGFAGTARHRASAMRRLYRVFIIACTVVAALIASAYGYFRYTFPYGWTHCCDKQLYWALRNYAELHNGRFPTGQSTPEACLSLLHAEPIQASAHLLCGKTVDPGIAERVFSEGQLLGPQTWSGWAGAGKMEPSVVAENGTIAGEAGWTILATARACVIRSVGPAK